MQNLFQIIRLTLLIFSILHANYSLAKTLTDQEIQDWFNQDALHYDPDNLHHGSGWNYLSREQYKEMVLDGASKMNPSIKPCEKVFDMGVGVGAALKVISDNVGGLTLGGSDIADNAIVEARKTFPDQAKNFTVQDMTTKHANIPDNYYDHVFSYGALAMYLRKSDMSKAIKEAVRMTKPGGSLLFTHFIAPGGKPRVSIIEPVSVSFFYANAKEWGIENIEIHKMKHQGDRYQVTCKKQ